MALAQTGKKQDDGITPAVPPVGPGAMPLTHTPKAPHSSARLRVRLSTAALAADACACTRLPCQRPGTLFPALPGSKASMMASSRFTVHLGSKRILGLLVLKSLGWELCLPGL